MDVVSEIKKHADDKHKDILLWLFERNHWASEWQHVAQCTFKKHGPESYRSHRVWSPTQNGLGQYFAPLMYAALQQVMQEGSTGPSDAAVRIEKLLAHMKDLDFWLSRPPDPEPVPSPT